MNETQFASRAAYGAATLFAVSLVRFFFIPRLGLPADSPGRPAELNGVATWLTVGPARLVNRPIAMHAPVPTASGLTSLSTQTVVALWSIPSTA
jgi:hypothetical protein